MNAFDTVHLLVPIEGVIWNDRDFEEGFKLGEGGELKSTGHHLKKGVVRPLGFSSVKILERGADIEFSAKLLGSGYVDGVSLETVDRIAPALRPIVDVDADALLSAELFRIDATANIRPRDVRRAIHSVAVLGSLNRRYRYLDYGGAGEQGFEFHSRAKSRNERIIGYDKEREMWRHKKVQAYALGVENFAGVLRVESNIRSREGMRGLLGFEETYTFADALNSAKNPNLILFDRVIENSEETFAIAALNKTEGKGMKHFQNIGIDCVIERYAGNWKAVEKYIRLLYGGGSNPSRTLKYVKERVALYHSRQSEAERLLEEVSEVREMLERAA